MIYPFKQPWLFSIPISKQSMCCVVGSAVSPPPAFHLLGFERRRPYRHPSPLGLLKQLQDQTGWNLVNKQPGKWHGMTTTGGSLVWCLFWYTESQLKIAMMCSDEKTWKDKVLCLHHRMLCCKRISISWMFKFSRHLDIFPQLRT